MRQHHADQSLTRILQSGLGITPGQEDALWSQFAARRAREATAWAAFAAGMVLLNARLRPAIQAGRWPGSYNPSW